MRGEYCVYGATAISLISAILLVFANIGQLSTAPLVSSLYFIDVNYQGFGTPFNIFVGGSDGLFTGDGKQPLGQGLGMRWYYRYGVYGACATVDKSSACNSTQFGYPFQPLGQVMADTSTDRGRRDAIPNLVGSDVGLYDANYNQIISRVANILIFLGSALCGVALVVGIFKTRVTFLVASITSGVSALCLLISGAMWSALIARNSDINGKMIDGNNSLGIKVTAGPSVYLVWVAFAFQTLSVIPYVISFLTFRRGNKVYD